MCVIILAENKKPTLEMLQLGEELNPHGAGMAWREKQKDGTVVVRWEKAEDLKAKDIFKATKRFVLPFVVHFRVASIGPRGDALCHPFPISEDVGLTRKGSSPEGVLFHNGTWTSWKDAVKRGIETGVIYPVPEGPWNDSRAMALLHHHYGSPAHLFIIPEEQRVAVLRPDTYYAFGTGWVDQGGVWTSNPLKPKENKVVYKSDNRFQSPMSDPLWEERYWGKRKGEVSIIRRDPDREMDWAALAGMRDDDDDTVEIIIPGTKEEKLSKREEKKESRDFGIVSWKPPAFPYYNLKLARPQDALIKRTFSEVGLRTTLHPRWMSVYKMIQRIEVDDQIIAGVKRLAGIPEGLSLGSLGGN